MLSCLNKEMNRHYRALREAYEIEQVNIEQRKKKVDDHINSFKL